MVQIGKPGITISALRVFAGSVWLTVATTLLCALLPTGLPQTSAVGSAFNPSTTVVALRSVEPGTRFVRAEAVRPRDPAPGVGGAIVLPAPLLPFRLALTAVAVPFGRSDPSWTVFTPRGAAFPRGPPLPIA